MLHCKYRTVLCDNFRVDGRCPYGQKCQFAHGVEQLRPASDGNALCYRVPRRRCKTRRHSPRVPDVSTDSADASDTDKVYVDCNVDSDCSSPRSDSHQRLMDSIERLWLEEIPSFSLP